MEGKGSSEPWGQRSVGKTKAVCQAWLGKEFWCRGRALLGEEPHFILPFSDLGKWIVLRTSKTQSFFQLGSAGVQVSMQDTAK